MKITCQKCQYTTSQALSRPSVSLDTTVLPSQPMPPHPTPPSDSQSPHQPTPPIDIFPSLPYTSTPLQSSTNQHKVLKDERTSPTSHPSPSPRMLSTPPWGEATAHATVSGGVQSKLASLLSLYPMKPQEEVWMKGETQAPTPGIIFRATSRVASPLNPKKVLSPLDPLLTKVNIDWCQQADHSNSSTSSPSLPHQQDSK